MSWHDLHANMLCMGLASGTLRTVGCLLQHLPQGPGDGSLCHSWGRSALRVPQMPLGVLGSLQRWAGRRSLLHTRRHTCGPAAGDGKQSGAWVIGLRLLILLC
jgi:hypothetical protein